MPDWDENSPQLQRNLVQLLARIAAGARERESPAVEEARRWHVAMMDRLDLPDRMSPGHFRGEPGLEDYEVTVGDNAGVAARDVRDALARFERTLKDVVAELDALIPLEAELDADKASAVLDLCAWAHAEWVRIHLFPNGNGRMARLMANGLAMRYGLPPFVRLRPRPNDRYAAVCELAMLRDWEPTSVEFRRMLNQFVDDLNP